MSSITLHSGKEVCYADLSLSIFMHTKQKFSHQAREWWSISFSILRLSKRWLSRSNTSYFSDSVDSFWFAIRSPLWRWRRPRWWWLRNKCNLRRTKLQRWILEKGKMGWTPEKIFLIDFCYIFPDDAFVVAFLHFGLILNIECSVLHACTRMLRALLLYSLFSTKLQTIHSLNKKVHSFFSIKKMNKSNIWILARFMLWLRHVHLFGTIFLCNLFLRASVLFYWTHILFVSFLFV